MCRECRETANKGLSVAEKLRIVLAGMQDGVEILEWCRREGINPTMYYGCRILKGENLVCPWRRRKKRRRQEQEKAKRPNEVWATDLKYVGVGERNYYLVRLLDEYSRYIVYHELLISMDGVTVSIAAQTALERWPTDEEGKLGERPAIRSDNGICYISREFGGALDEHGLSHRKIKLHYPEQNGTMERANRTIDDTLGGEYLTNYLEGVKVIKKMIRWYNEQRLHSALGFLRPVDCCRGDREALFVVRRHKLAQARHRRREKNLQLRQPPLPFTSEEAVA